MAKILVTGGSGMIGGAVVRRLGRSADLVVVSRTTRPPLGTWVEGAFQDEAVIERVDAERFDAVVHLAAEFGGDLQRCLAVNVDGTTALVRRLAATGTRRFLLASSIAAVGCLDPGFEPTVLPIPDDAPSRAVDAYGISKARMEIAVAGLVAVRPELDVTAFRVGVVGETARLEAPTAPYADLSRVPLLTVVDAFERALHAPARPGMRRINLVTDGFFANGLLAELLR